MKFVCLCVCVLKGEIFCIGHNFFRVLHCQRLIFVCRPVLSLCLLLVTLAKCDDHNLRRSSWKSQQARDQFCKAPFRPKTFRIDFLPQIFDKFPTKKLHLQFIMLLWTILLDFMVYSTLKFDQNRV
jgi:hypothetical protein